MKLRIIIIVIFINSIFICSCDGKIKNQKPITINKVNLYVNFIKIYGVLKYYHPLYSTGKKSIDSLFLRTIPKIDTTHSILSYNKLIHIILNKGVYKKENSIDSTILSFQAGILDSINLSNIARLLNRHIDRTSLFYVKNYKGNIGEALFINESLKNDTVFPNYKIRLLAIAKYWNALNYFYPYKSDIPNFNLFIKRYIPKILTAKNAQEYHLNILELTSSIQDAHVKTKSSVLRQFWGHLFLPFTIVKINNKFYVNLVIEKDIDLHPKDQILEINHITTDTIKENLKNYISTTNKEHFDYLLCNLMVKTNKKEIEIKYINQAKDTVTKHVNSISNAKYVLSVNHFKKSFIKNDTAYLDLINVSKKEIDVAFSTKKVIILDLRNHIKNGLMYYIANKLFPQKIKYFLLSMPDLDKPGSFKYIDDYMVGGKNTHTFRGYLIVLCNGNTMSQAETALMIFKKYNRTTVVGRTSCGANGNVTYLNLPGKIKTRFSGVGVYELNKTKIQFKGIKPDIII